MINKWETRKYARIRKGIERANTNILPRLRNENQNLI